MVYINLVGTMSERVYEINKDGIHCCQEGDILLAMLPFGHPEDGTEVTIPIPSNAAESCLGYVGNGEFFNDAEKVAGEWLMDFCQQINLHLLERGKELTTVVFGARDECASLIMDHNTAWGFAAGLELASNMVALLLAVQHDVTLLIKESALEYRSGEEDWFSYEESGEQLISEFQDFLKHVNPSDFESHGDS